MNKDEYAKIYAYNRVIKHLHEGKKDKRSRERMRSQVALSTLKLWYTEGEEEYEQTTYKD